MENNDTEKKKKVQKIVSLAKYIDQLFIDMKKLFERSRRWMKIEMTAMLTLLITVFVASSVIAIVLAFNLWIVIFLFRGLMIDVPLNKKFGEIEGAIAVLRYLGLVDDEKPRGKKDKKNKRALFDALRETWGRIKQGVPQLSPQLSMTKYGDI